MNQELIQAVRAGSPFAFRRTNRRFRRVDVRDFAEICRSLFETVSGRIRTISEMQSQTAKSPPVELQQTGIRRHWRRRHNYILPKCFRHSEDANRNSTHTGNDYGL